VVMEVWVLHMNKETTGIAMITISRPQIRSVSNLKLDAFKTASNTLIVIK
jgi:hypothetical protein